MFKGIRLIPDDTKLKFMQISRYGYLVSGILCALSILLFAVLVDSIAEAVAAVRRLDRLDRGGVRHDFEQRFSVSRQAEQYEQLYRRVIDVHADPMAQDGRHPLHRPSPPPNPLLHAS